MTKNSIAKTNNSTSDNTSINYGVNQQQLEDSQPTSTEDREMQDALNRVHQENTTREFCSWNGGCN